MNIPNNDFNTAQRIWWVSIASLPLLLLGCHIVGIQIEFSEKAPVSVMEIRTGCFVITIWLYASMNIFRSNRLKSDPIPDTAQNTSGETKNSVVFGLQRYSFSILVCMALSEAIALLGFMLCMLGDDKQIVYLFVAISAIAMAILRPKPEEFEKYQNLTTPN